MPYMPPDCMTGPFLRHFRQFESIYGVRLFAARVPHCIRVAPAAAGRTYTWNPSWMSYILSRVSSVVSDWCKSKMILENTFSLSGRV